MKKRDIKSIFVLIICLLSLFCIIQSASSFCQVDGYVTNLSGSPTIGNITVYCKGLSQYKSSVGNSYSQIFGNLPDNCAVCSNLINSSAGNSTLEIFGYTTRTSSFSVSEVQLNISMHEINKPFVFMGTNVPNGNVTNQTTMTFDAKCYDDVEVDAIRIYGSWGGGGWKATNMSPVNNTWWNVSISGVSSGTWYVWCNDSSGNTNQTGTRSLTVDTSVAAITLNSPANHAILKSSGDTQTVTMAWTPTDFGSNLNCSLYINDSLETIKACTSGSRCNYAKEFQQNTTGITYEWQVNCSDGSREATSETRDFTAKKTSSGGGGGGGGGGGTGACGDGICNRSGALYTFDCYADNYESLSNISLYGSWNNWHLIDTKTASGSNANVSFSVSFNQSNSYTWNCYVCGVLDGVMNCDFVLSNQTISINATGGGENQQNCCADCGCPAGQSCENNACVNLTDCGNGVCDVGETFSNCCKDCACPLGQVCTGNSCIPSQQPVFVCGNNICETGENSSSCPQDCINSICGNGKCEAGESSSNCCKDCGCLAGEKCTDNLCKKSRFPWWILWILSGILVLAAAYWIIRGVMNKKDLMWVVLSIGKEIDKKKFNEIQKKSKGKKMDYEEQNKKIGKYIELGLGICKKWLKESIEKEEIQALKKFVENKKELLHTTTVLFEDYKKVVKKERLAFEEDLKEILFSEEIPKYSELKKEVIDLYSVIRQIKALKVTSFKETKE